MGSRDGAGMRGELSGETGVGAAGVERRVPFLAADE